MLTTLLKSTIPSQLSRLMPLRLDLRGDLRVGQLGLHCRLIPSCRVWGLGVGVWGLGIGVWGLGCRVLGLGFWVQGTVGRMSLLATS